MNIMEIARGAVLAAAVAVGCQSAGASLPRTWMADWYGVAADSAETAAPWARALPFTQGRLHRPVFDTYELLDTLTLANAGAGAGPAFEWLEQERLSEALVRHARRAFFVNHPEQVRYVADWLPEPPRSFVATIDPETAKIVITERTEQVEIGRDLAVVVKKRHWPKVAQASLQFSQAYISPNWYQGGNNNVNALLNLYYNVKLNPAFHPNWLLETTVQYKLGLNNAPDDKLRDYNISEDLLQWNFMAGHKAARHWYYSTNITFKTQLLNSYKPNTQELKAAFLSPGELNVGLGMTYNYVNPAKTFQVDVSLSPLSWNLKTCTNSRLDKTAFGVRQNLNARVNYGSNFECKVTWQMAHNIKMLSRWFAFTDYGYFQADWENTLQFAVNRYLSTQIYVHARYDSNTPRVADDTQWHKLQLKEILSFGIAYNFKSI